MWGATKLHSITFQEKKNARSRFSLEVFRPTYVVEETARPDVTLSSREGLGDGTSRFRRMRLCPLERA